MGTDSTIRDDIAYMRGLAEEGRKGPVLGASILFYSGLIYSAAAVASWAIHSGRLAMDLPVPGTEWWVAGIIQLVVVVVMSRRLRGQPVRANASSRLFGIVWGSMGTAIFVFVAALGLLHWRFDQGAVWMVMPAIVMALYGAAWSVNAWIVKRSWMHIIGILSYAAAILTAFMIDLPDSSGLLAYAVVIFLVISVPGLILMREGGLAQGSAA